MYNPLPAIQHAMSYGVAVGLMKRNVFPESIIADLNRFFARNGIPGQDIPNVFISLKIIVLRDEVVDVERFTEGTTCKIVPDNEEECIMEISQTFQVGPVDDKHYIFVN